ncbi:MAG: J domain-containing protein [Aquificae bacterium]|nr:J domain-containing protein [Aquificota bacterium]
MDFYSLLGVSRDASPEEIKKAFREKAKKYHPDLNPEKADYFKQLTHAYDVLIDPEKRRRYDLTLKKLEKKELSSIIGDLLSDFLGFHTKPVKGEDLKLKLKITVEEGYRGAVKEVRYKRKVNCPSCNGEGKTENSYLTYCNKCGGKGRIKKAFIEIPCLSCFGRGVEIKNPCPRCRGIGRVKKTEIKKVKIPAGITEGEVIILKGMGNDGINRGEAGDLIIKPSFKKGKYILKKLDVYTEVRINGEKLKDSRLIAVKDIEGNTLLLPAENTGRPVRYRIKNRGYRDRSGRRGDFVVRIVPV